MLLDASTMRVSPTLRRPMEVMLGHLSVLSTLDTCCTAAYTVSLAVRGEWVWVHASVVVFAVTALLSWGALLGFRERSETRLYLAIALQLGVPVAAVLRLRTPDVHAPATPGASDADLVHSSLLVPALLAAQAFGGAALHVHVQLLALAHLGPPALTPLACTSLALAVRTVLAAIIAHNSLALELLAVSAHVLPRVYELCAWSSRLLAFTLFSLAFRDGAFALLNVVIISSVVVRLLIRNRSCSWATWGHEYTRTLCTTLVPIWLRFGDHDETTRSNVALSAWLSFWEMLAGCLALSSVAESRVGLSTAALLTSLPPAQLIECQQSWHRTLRPGLAQVAAGALACLTCVKLCALASSASRFHALRAARLRRWRARSTLARAVRTSDERATVRSPSPGLPARGALFAGRGEPATVGASAPRGDGAGDGGSASGVGGSMGDDFPSDVEEGGTSAPLPLAVTSVRSVSAALDGAAASLGVRGSHAAPAAGACSAQLDRAPQLGPQRAARVASML